MYDDNGDFLDRLKFADDIEDDEELKGIEQQISQRASIIKVPPAATASPDR